MKSSGDKFLSSGASKLLNLMDLLCIKLLASNLQNKSEEKEYCKESSRWVTAGSIWFCYVWESHNSYTAMRRTCLHSSLKSSSMHLEVLRCIQLPSKRLRCMMLRGTNGGRLNVNSLMKGHLHHRQALREGTFTYSVAMTKRIASKCLTLICKTNKKRHRRSCLTCLLACALDHMRSWSLWICKRLLFSVDLSWNHLVVVRVSMTKTSSNSKKAECLVK